MSLSLEALLSVERLDGSARAEADPHTLGALGYGLAPGADGLHAEVLWPGGASVDAWRSAGPFASGRCGSVRWRHDGQWLYGAVELDEAAQGCDLQALAQQAYRDIFSTLKLIGLPHLQRLWNYLPGINADGGGLERYRQFNAGRQIAFLEAGYAAFEGAPAACAIGTRSGPFCVRFLAGRQRPVPVENPRQVSAYHYPSAYGPRAPTFSRAALARAGGGRTALLVSGTASIVGHASLHAGDVAAQARETLANLQAVIDAAHRRCSARFSLQELECVVYVRHREHLAGIREVFENAVGPGSRAARSAVYLEADICRSDLLVEIEGHAFSPGDIEP